MNYQEKKRFITPLDIPLIPRKILPVKDIVIFIPDVEVLTVADFIDHFQRKYCLTEKEILS